MRDYFYFFQCLIALLMCYSHPAGLSLRQAPSHKPPGSASYTHISALSIPEFPPQAHCLSCKPTNCQVSEMFFLARDHVWLPSQDVDVPVAAGGGKPELHIELARNLQEDGDAGQVHLRRGGLNIPFLWSSSPSLPWRDWLLFIWNLNFLTHTQLVSLNLYNFSGGKLSNM